MYLLVLYQSTRRQSGCNGPVAATVESSPVGRNIDLCSLGQPKPGLRTSSCASTPWCRGELQAAMPRIHAWTTPVPFLSPSDACFFTRRPRTPRTSRTWAWRIAHEQSRFRRRRLRRLGCGTLFFSYIPTTFPAPPARSTWSGGAAQTLDR